MPEETLFKVEQERDRSEIADMLRDVADKLDAGDDVTFSAGDESVTLSPPSRPTFEISVERETQAGPDELSIELELEWDDVEETDASLSIE